MALTKPFAQNGNKTTIPQTTSDGSVSYDQGFGSFYALPPEEGGLFIDRAQFNQLMYDTTSQVLENKTAIATKANANATVNLSGDQTINGVKTFTSNISSPNIANLETQINNIFGGNKVPYLLQPNAVSITVGTGGTFTNLNDAFSYIKQINSKQINSNTNITLLSDFNGDIALNAFPPCVINCNGFKLGNSLTIKRTPVIELKKLKLSGQLYAIFCGAVLVNSGTTLGGGNSGTPTFDASIVANSSNILIDDDVTLNPSSNSFGIVSKGVSRVLLASPSTWTQNIGRSFVRVVSGGIVSADDAVDLSGVSVPKTNLTVNTLTSQGIIMGTIWG